MDESEDFQVGVDKGVESKAGYATVEYDGEEYQILDLSVVESVASRDGEHPLSDVLSAPIKGEPEGLRDALSESETPKDTTKGLRDALSENPKDTTE